MYVRHFSLNFFELTYSFCPAKHPRPGNPLLTPSAPRSWKNYFYQDAPWPQLACIILPSRECSQDRTDEGRMASRAQALSHLPPLVRVQGPCAGEEAQLAPLHARGRGELCWPGAPPEPHRTHTAPGGHTQSRGARYKYFI